MSKVVGRGSIASPPPPNVHVISFYSSLLGLKWPSKERQIIWNKYGVYILQWMAAGENGGRGPSIVPRTVCKKEKGIGQGRGQERALILLHGGMDSIAREKTPIRRFAVGTC